MEHGYDADGVAVEITPNLDAKGKPRSATLTEKGRELGDPVPMEPPLGIYQTPSLIEQIRRSVAEELSRQAAAQGFETWEEANDFDVPGDPLDPSSPYEEQFEPTPPPPHMVGQPPATPAPEPAKPPSAEPPSGGASVQEKNPTPPPAAPSTAT